MHTHLHTPILPSSLSLMHTHPFTLLILPSRGQQSAILHTRGCAGVCVYARV